MEEVWGIIPHFKNYYEASNFGRVRSVARKIKRKDGQVNSYKSQVIKSHKDKDGYDILELSVDGKFKKMKVHRLVCMTFKPIDNCEKFQVDHIDEDKSNNFETNLQWLSPSEHNVKSKAGHFTFISPSGEVVEVYNLRQFCRDNNLINGSMSKVNTGKQKNHKGWKKWIK